MLSLALGIFAVLVLLAVFWVMRARHLAAMVQDLARTADPSVTRVGLVAMVPVVGAPFWLITRGLEPPTALMVGVVLGLGVFCASLGLLGMEGALLEPESVALARKAQRRPAPSTPRGRIVAVLVGLALVAGALYLVTRAT